MPLRPLAWSSWNYLTASSPSAPLPSAPSTSTLPSSSTPSGALTTVTLTYNMNTLQHLPVSRFGHILVTLNPPHPPSPHLTQGKYEYTHPLYNAAAVRAQGRLGEIQGRRGVWYAGAWTGYGFHEDGFASGVKVACELGGAVPWRRADAKFSRGRRPVLGAGGYAVRAVVMIIMAVIRAVGIVLGVFWGSRAGEGKKEV